MATIQYIGLKGMEPVDQAMVKKIVVEESLRIERALKNLETLVVHIKPYSKGGARPKYSVHVRAVAPTKVFESAKSRQAAHWDISSAIRSAFDNIEREVQHAFHGEKRPREVLRGGLVHI
jgi:hypothetical protein